MRCGDLTLNPATHQVQLGGKEITLSAKEFSVLHALVDRAGAILSRVQLEQHLYGWNEEIESNAIEVHIHNLRKKLGGEFIRNVRGVGYTVARS